MPSAYGLRRRPKSTASCAMLLHARVERRVDLQTAFVDGLLAEDVLELRDRVRREVRIRDSLAARSGARAIKFERTRRRPHRPARA